MEERIIEFIAALRSAGVRVSLAESSDAFHAIQYLGIKDRETFKTCLMATLIKDSINIPLFNELFPLFFGNSVEAPMLNVDAEMTQAEAEMIAQALRQFNDQIRQMLERLMRGEQLSQDELNRLAKMVGLTQVDDLRYRDWMLQRLRKAMRYQQVREALQQLAELLNQMGMDRDRISQLSEMIQANQRSIDNQLRQLAGQQIAQNMSRKVKSELRGNLYDQPFNTLSDRDMEDIRKEVKRLSAILRSRVALRQKRAKSGQLDPKATIRANLKHSNVPIQIKHREHTLKPKLVVICDVSTSMRFCSELMLSLLFNLHDQITKTHAFAFINHLEHITPDFQGREVREAVRHVLGRMPSGYYNTDFGYSLDNFTKEYLDTVDSRTIFLVVGDGRNNYNDPRVDLFRTIARRSRKTIWLTPEAISLWGTGDSDMFEYSPHCDAILQVSTLAELTTAVDKLLTVH